MKNFLFWSGTGKSWNANEFHKMENTCLSAQEDKELSLGLRTLM